MEIHKDTVRNDLDYLRADFPKIFKIHSHTNQWEKALIYQLCKKLPTGSVMFEIGAHLGATSCIMGAAAKKINGTAYCVDTWDNQNFPGELAQDTYKDWLNNTKDYRAHTLSYRGDSKCWAQKLKGYDYKIDLIFFDADHSYEGITGDIRVWLPLCAPGCCLVFHDYGGKDGRPEIRQALEELIFPVRKGPGYVFESIYYTNLP